MKRERLTGFQIALFIFALSIVCIPLSRWALSALGPGWEEQQVFRSLLFSVAALLIVSFPRVRSAAGALLRPRIPNEARREVACVAAFDALMPLAAAGFFALSTLLQSGPSGPERLIAMQIPPQHQLEHTFSRAGVFIFIAGVFAAPIVEELIFRGFLFKAWEERWGWLWAAILSSSMFAVYHPHFLVSFVDAFVFVAVFRRTASLQAAIFVHAVHNLCLSYPLLGQFVIPTEVRAGFFETWWLQLTVLSFALLALPYYVAKARKAPQST